jgi:hypothetical protein
LLNLSFKVVLADNIPGFVESDLTRDKDNGSPLTTANWE